MPDFRAFLNSGLEILEVAEDNILSELGLKNGDIISNINSEKIDSIDILDLILKEILLEKRKSANMEILRNNKKIFIDLFKLFR